MIAETVCSAVSAAGLGIAVVTAYRRRFLAAARIAAYALVPVGLVMTGLVGWLAHTAFSPTAWAGFGLLGAAWLLFAGTRAVERRRAGRAAAGSERTEAVAPGSSAPSLGGSSAASLGAGSRPAKGSAAPRPTGSAAPTDDFSDIEAILKKHGI
ncbi:hypothetical protein [Streptomyces sp. NBC_00557]|uniref:hypothetical protein n=1 Tax=Streptomyces sp. NBC_00557 TaxID=2975776 RepID=UPI002E8088D8|nr:hypothetical protein [Streptomyces sp. NBC_00557]WUC38159.1 hypothetical protein OG956_30005 [Streptomyces sp. NBC_00557]